jgi:hypothetical protein
MSTSTNLTARTEVVVELNAGLEPAATGERGRRLQRLLQPWVEGLLADLQIPGPLSLAVEPARGSFGPDESGYRIFLNGRKCRLSVPNQGADELGSAGRAGAIARDIFANRELLVSAPVVHRARERWLVDTPASHLAGLSVEASEELLRGLAARCFRLVRAGEPTAPPGETPEGGQGAATGLEETIAAVSSLKILLSPARRGAEVGGAAGVSSLERAVEPLRDRLFDELGLILPPVVVEADAALEGNELRLQLNDVRTPPLTRPDPERRLSDDAILQILARQIRNHAGAFVTTDTVHLSLILLSEEYPTLVDAVRARFDLAFLTQVLRALADENISIRDLRPILEALLLLSGTTTVDMSALIVFFPQTADLCPVAEGTTREDLRPADYADCVRMSLQLQLSHQYAQTENTLKVILLTRDLERRIQRAGQNSFSDEEQDRLIAAVWHEARPTPGRMMRVVLLTTFTVRRPLRRLIEKELPWLPVVSYQELSPDLTIVPQARIAWYE